MCSLVTLCHQDWKSGNLCDSGPQRSLLPRPEEEVSFHQHHNCLLLFYMNGGGEQGSLLQEVSRNTPLTPHFRGFLLPGQQDSPPGNPEISSLAHVVLDRDASFQDPES